MEPQNCNPDTSTSTVARGWSNLGATAPSATLHGGLSATAARRMCWASSDRRSVIATTTTPISDAIPLGDTALESGKNARPSYGEKLLGSLF